MVRLIWGSVIAIVAWLMVVPAQAVDEAERPFSLPAHHLTAIPYGVTAIDLDGDGKATEKIYRARLSDAKGPGFRETILFSQHIGWREELWNEVRVAATSVWPGETAIPELFGIKPLAQRLKDIAAHGACPGLEAWLARDPGHQGMAAHLVLAWYVPEAAADHRRVRFALFQLRDRFLDAGEAALTVEPQKVPPYPDAQPRTQGPFYDFVLAARFTAAARYGPCRLTEALRAAMSP